MAIHKAEAVVLRNYKIRESSLIVSFFTREFGKINCVAKGIRRKEPRFASRLIPFSLNQIIFYRSRRGMLHTLSECVMREGFFPLREDLAKIAVASYFVELLDELTRWEDRNEDLFFLLAGCLNHLALNTHRERLLRFFEIKALALTGFAPRVESCAQCGRPAARPYRFNGKKGGLVCPVCVRGGAQGENVSPAVVTAIRRLKTADMRSELNVEVPGRIERELRYLLRKFIYLQLEKPLKTVAFLDRLEREKRVRYFG